jgi:hypothetical protein
MPGSLHPGFSATGLPTHVVGCPIRIWWGNPQFQGATHNERAQPRAPPAGVDESALGRRRPLLDQPAQDQPAQDQPAQDQPAQDQLAPDQPALGKVPGLGLRAGYAVLAGGLRDCVGHGGGDPGVEGGRDDVVGAEVLVGDEGGQGFGSG